MNVVVFVQTLHLFTAAPFPFLSSLSLVALCACLFLSAHRPILFACSASSDTFNPRWIRTAPKCFKMSTPYCVVCWAGPRQIMFSLLLLPPPSIPPYLYKCHCILLFIHQPPLARCKYFFCKCSHAVTYLYTFQHPRNPHCN